MKKAHLFLLIILLLAAITAPVCARNVYVARHGQVGFPVKAISETRLTDLGIEQAQQLADYLVNQRKFNGNVYVSPFYRTTETETISTFDIFGKHFYILLFRLFLFTSRPECK